jgi:type I restriction enzyme R subunit
MNEAETCRTTVRPKLEAAGWEANGERHYREQVGITAGRIVVTGGQPKRLKRKVPDFLLYFTRDVLLAVVEAKSDRRPAADGLQQAKDYAQTLGLSFAYSTNGAEVIEYDFLTHAETVRADFPTPAELWQRYQIGMSLSSAVRDALLVPDFYDPKKIPWYYQRIAIERAVRAIVGGQKRCLLTLATGTGKTTVAFQICWKLWSAKWTADGDPVRKPRILFLADRNKLVDDPKDRDFKPFGDARHKIAGKAEKGREMYFALYQALADDDTRPGLYRQYPPDYFDLIVIDECHRGSAGDEGRWRDILTYFHPAYQLGMTATPLREDNRDTYLYFGNPLYTYSLKQGIEDGFLAPYRVRRVVTTFDSAGWRPTKAQLDKRNRPIPDQEYGTKDFERVISLEARNNAIARHLTDYLRKTDPYAKTIVFCVDQDHASLMRQAIHNLNKDLAAEGYQEEGSPYVARVTADEGDIGGGFLGRFQDPENNFPVILTTSQLLTTGVDAPTCKNVVLVRVIGSMTEFKQIIGRGTRTKEEYGKLFFTILDYTGSATQKFADKEWDGELPEYPVEEIDEYGRSLTPPPVTPPDPPEEGDGANEPGGGFIPPEPPPGFEKYRTHGGPGGIDTEIVYDLDPSGKKLRTVEIAQYTREEVRKLSTTADDLRARWARPATRAALLAELDQRGIDFPVLAAEAGQPDADPFDLLCHLAYNAPLLTRRQRADKLRTGRADFFDQYGPDARAVLVAVLDKYAEHGVGQFAMPDVLKVPPLSALGTPAEIAARFPGGAEGLLAAIDRLQEYLYAA